METKMRLPAATALIFVFMYLGCSNKNESQSAYSAEAQSGEALPQEEPGQTDPGLSGLGDSFKDAKLGSNTGTISGKNSWEEVHDYSEGNEHFNYEFRTEYYANRAGGALYELDAITHKWSAVKNY
ncbi:hypothetical protein LQZ19_16750 [Treponema primitia]|uniref:hypothetical protein n=1 Tax=Treponema primitia TaxID=88058 RepID=UPI003980EFF7